MNQSGLFRRYAGLRCLPDRHPPNSQLISRSYNSHSIPIKRNRGIVNTGKVVSLLSPLQAVALTVAIGGGVIGAMRWFGNSVTKPEKVYTSTAFHNSVLSRCPTINSEYRRFGLLWNGHVESIWGAWFRTNLGTQYRREILRRPDGGSVALDFLHGTESPDLPDDAPVLILLPGLAGGSDGTYVQYAVQGARENGIRPVVFNSRGTGGSPVTSAQFYSASYTGDTRAVVNYISEKFPNSTLLAMGWSLGGNILINYLGEEGEKTPVKAAVSLCNPFDLVCCDKVFKEGFCRVYNWDLGRAMRRLFAPHGKLFNGIGGEFNVDLAHNAKSVRDFDEAITRVSFGWKSVDAYYEGSGSYKSIPKVKIPLLCIQALDDPIAVKEAIPYKQIRENSNCVLVTTPSGGHLGWVAGDESPFGAPWSNSASIEWINSVLTEFAENGVSNNGVKLGVKFGKPQLVQLNGNGVTDKVGIEN